MQRFQIGSVTDVFSPDVGVAAAEMRRLGLAGAELRTIGGQNILEVDRVELERALSSLRENQLEIVAIATALLKCSLDDWKTQSRQAERAFDIANLAGARIVRVFSGARVAEPQTVFEHVVDILQELADKAARRGLIVALEN